MIKPRCFMVALVYARGDEAGARWLTDEEGMIIACQPAIETRAVLGSLFEVRGDWAISAIRAKHCEEFEGWTEIHAVAIEPELTWKWHVATWDFVIFWIVRFPRYWLYKVLGI